MIGKLVAFIVRWSVPFSVRVWGCEDGGWRMLLLCVLSRIANTSLSHRQTLIQN